MSKVNWDKVKDIVGAVAPTVGAALGGPFGAIAGKAISEALGESDEAKIVEALKADPNKVLELKKAEIAFQQFMRDAEIREEQLVYSDKASARDLGKSQGLHAQIALSALFVTGYFGVLVMIMTGVISAEDAMKDVVILLLGLLVREIPTIMQFWFGTSIGSKEKSAQIAADIDRVVGVKR